MPIVPDEASIAGSEASDERVEIATACGAISPRVKVGQAGLSGDCSERISGERDEDADGRDDRDIMTKPGERRAAGRCADREGKREHAERRDRKHPGDDHQQGIRDGIEQADDDAAPVGRDPGQRQCEQDGKDGQRQDVAVVGRGERRSAARLP